MSTAEKAILQGEGLISVGASKELLIVTLANEVEID